MQDLPFFPDPQRERILLFEHLCVLHDSVDARFDLDSRKIDKASETALALEPVLGLGKDDAEVEIAHRRVVSAGVAPAAMVKLYDPGSVAPAKGGGAQDDPAAAEAAVRCTQAIF